MSDYTTQDLEDNLNYLEETKRQIKNTLISKGQEVSDEDTFRSYVNKIDNIGSGATASKDEVVKGYTIYKNGELIEGTIEPKSSIKTASSYPARDYPSLSVVTVKGGLNIARQGYLLRNISQNITIEIDTAYSRLVDAIGLTANQIVKGYTVLGVEGTAEIPDYNAKFTDEISSNTGAQSSPSDNRFFKFIKKVDLTNITITTNSLRSLFWEATNLEEVAGFPDTSSVINTDSMFQNCRKLTSISSFDTSNVTTMHSMFYQCNNLETIPLLDTSSVTNMSEMFRSCQSLKSIPLLNTSNVTTMHDIFNDCRSLTTIPLIDTSKATDLYYMFYNCINLESIPLLDTSSNTMLNATFASCPKLTTIPLIDTSNVTNMQSTFTSSTGLKTLPLLDTSSVTSMFQMCYGCSSLEEVPAFNTSSVLNIKQAFQGCTSLVTVNQLDLSSATDTQQMFQNCTSLENIPAFNLASINQTGMTNMFSNCPSLTNTSLNNILATCISATNITSTYKNLRLVGLTSSQATICESLSNYQDFLDAGWSKGY